MKQVACTFFVIFGIAVLTVIDGRAQGSANRGSNAAGEGFYSEAQATRGKATFATACAACHTIDAQAPPASATAGATAKIPLAGRDVIQKWRSVGDLFSKVRRTMPAMNANGLADDAYLDVVAYMLQGNGFAAGKALTTNTSSLHTLVLAKPGAGRVAVNNLASTAWYTDEQAKRGEGYFRGNCMTCHTTNADGKPTEAEAATGHKGSMFGGPGNYRVWPIAAQGGRRWGTVWGLYNKISQTMPAHDPGGLSRETYADIAAYFLKIYGLPAGSEELNVNVNTMKSMNLNEPGFERMFDGRDFTGIKFVIGAQCAPKPAGCAQAEPKGAFSVENGTIASAGTPEGYWYFDKKYLNFTLRFDFQFDLVPGLETASELLSNSGYLLFITEHGVWPKCIEIQGAYGLGVLSAFGVNAQVKATSDDDARRRVLRPADQWNSAEIISKNGVVTALLNGTLITTVSEHEFKEAGYIGFQSEGGHLRWRNIRIKPE